MNYWPIQGGIILIIQRLNLDKTFATKTQRAIFMALCATSIEIRSSYGQRLCNNNSIQNPKVKSHLIIF
jgi:hypothetical protein